MKQGDEEGNLDGPEQQAEFELEGPDEDGCVWICSPQGGDTWCRNLGPYEAVATKMADWLGEKDFGE